MTDEVYSKFEVEVFDSKNNLRNVIEFYNKDDAIKSFKSFKLLYKDKYIVSLTYTKTYVQFPCKK